MATTTVNAGNKAIEFNKKFFIDYIRGNEFSKYMGSDENACIHVKDDSSPGTTVSFPLVLSLTGAGVEGAASLVGSEEAMSNYAHTLTTTYVRNGVTFTKEVLKEPAFDLRSAGRATLMNWAMTKVRSEILAALHSIDGVAYGAASEAGKDAWLAANADRVLFGSATANNAANDHSASLANVDASADKLTRSVVDLAKRLSLQATPAIRPIRVTNKDGEIIETYVLFAGVEAFRDLSADLETVHQNAGVRGAANPLFREGDLLWKNVVVRQVPSISTDLKLSGVGATGIDVCPAFLCGAQAIAYGIKDKMSTITQDNVNTDYDFQKGVAAQEMRKINKFQFNGKDHGVFTLYTAAVGD